MNHVHMWSEAVDARENSVGTADAVPWPCDLTAYPLRRYGLTPLCAVAQYASYYGLCRWGGLGVPLSFSDVIG